MSLIAIAAGKLLKAPAVRHGKDSKPYTVGTLRAATDDGDVIVNVLAFDSVGETLAVLGAGNTLSATGRAKFNYWTGTDGQECHGLRMVADGVLTPYQVGVRKRRVAGAVAGEDQ